MSAESAAAAKAQGLVAEPDGLRRIPVAAQLQYQRDADVAPAPYPEGRRWVCNEQRRLSARALGPRCSVPVQRKAPPAARQSSGAGTVSGPDNERPRLIWAGTRVDEMLPIWLPSGLTQQTRALRHGLHGGLIG
jgi:hypothetical protein